MAFLQQGASATVTIPAAQSIRVGAYRNALATVNIPLGLPSGPQAIVRDGAVTFGPYAAGATVTVQAAYGEIEYVVGASPVLTDNPFNPAGVAITGGTINGASVGVTTPAIVKASEYRANFADSSGAPGNATNNNPSGRAAFAAAGSTVVITSSLVTAASVVQVSLEGSDATLTSIRAQPAAGSFTVTGNAAATATTKFSWVIFN